MTWTPNFLLSEPPLIHLENTGIRSLACTCTDQVRCLCRFGGFYSSFVLFPFYYLDICLLSFWHIVLPPLEAGVGSGAYQISICIFFSSAHIISFPLNVPHLFRCKFSQPKPSGAGCVRERGGRRMRWREEKEDADNSEFASEMGVMMILPMILPLESAITAARNVSLCTWGLSSCFHKCSLLPMKGDQ